VKIPERPDYTSIPHHRLIRVVMIYLGANDGERCAGMASVSR